MSHSLVGTLPLAVPALDRDSLARTRPELFDELLADPATRVLALHGGKALLDASGTGIALLRPYQVTSAVVRVYLGRTLEGTADEPTGTPIITVVLTAGAAGELASEETRWAGLRTIATRLSSRDAGLCTAALAVANWHESHTHCPRCGTPTVVEAGGWMRHCLVDGNEVFPRTDPAVICAVLDAEGRLLLGSNALWENNRWSLLAGFVEAGESFEAAVLREIHEEAGIEVTEPEYLGSQPWPFPASVMIGYRARLAEGVAADALVPDGEEILALRWFSRDDMWAERDEIILPGGASIAHAIVADWYGGPLDQPPRVR